MAIRRPFHRLRRRLGLAGPGCDTPELFQINEMDCGPANLRAIALAFGVHVPNEESRRLTQASREGASLSDLYFAALRLGFEAEMNVVDLYDLRTFAAERLPCITLVVIPGMGLLHFVTIYEVEKRRVLVMDPGTGLGWWSLEYFQQRCWRFEQPADPTAVAADCADPENHEHLSAGLESFGYTTGEAEAVLDRVHAYAIDDRLKYARYLRESGILQGRRASR
ncbi:MAG: hypothetical protein HYV63_24520 [Candidatus Schekmanbacteria bacterium]|nr:hypothetical protein [Candidatus Schekmanbacteria bacterium]